MLSFNSYIKEQWMPRRKPDYIQGISTPQGLVSGLGNDDGSFENPWQNAGPGFVGDGDIGHDPDEYADEREDWGWYYKWLHGLPEIPDGEVEPIDVQTNWRFPETETGSDETPSGLNTSFKLRPYITTHNWSSKPETPEAEDTTLEFDNPYAFRGITNDYGLLRKKNINFNEI